MNSGLIINVIVMTLLVLALLIVISIGLFLIYRNIVRSRILNEHRITDKNGIDQELIIKIGGIEQYLYIRGENKNNPIILFLHGGPGGSMAPMIYSYQYGWESNYTVVNWDQRNTGRTYFLNKDRSHEVISTLSVDVVVEDIRKIVIYLKDRFNKNKIIIMGHSWGSVIGTIFVQRYPDLTQAYIGVAQVVDLDESTLKMAEKVRNFALEKNSLKDVQKLDQLVANLGQSLIITEKTASNIYKVAKKYIKHNLDNMIFFRVGSMSPYFSMKHLSYFLKVEILQAPLFEYITEYDLREFSPRYRVPMIFIMGEYDLHLKYLLDEYYLTIEAPYKKLVYIKNAGHVVMMDQPDEFQKVLMSVLKGVD